MKIILGIDPGSLCTGFGVIQLYNSEDGVEQSIEHLTHGIIAPPGKLPFHERIAIIGEEVDKLIRRIKPDVTVIEQVFLGKNADSAFKLGHARGVIMASAVRGRSEVVEYSTRLIKKGITGSGASSKEQVQTVLFALLGITRAARADASDALALAFYHARCLEVERTLMLNRKRFAKPESEL